MQILNYLTEPYSSSSSFFLSLVQSIFNNSSSSSHFIPSPLPVHLNLSLIHLSARLCFLLSSPLPVLPLVLPFHFYPTPLLFLFSSLPQALFTLSCSCRTLILHYHRSYNTGVHTHTNTVRRHTLSLHLSSICALCFSSFEQFLFTQLESHV